MNLPESIQKANEQLSKNVFEKSEPLRNPLQMGRVTIGPSSFPSNSVKEWNEAVESINKWAEGLKPLADHLANVRFFSTTFGQPAPESPTVPSRDVTDLRDRLIGEESLELIRATTPAECLDAVCDQLYVVLGSAVACGFSAEQINRGLAEVHRSNMTKLWTHDEVESAALSGVHLQCTVDVPVRFDARVYIVRSKEGKILKPPGYSPADLSWIEDES